MQRLALVIVALAGSIATQSLPRVTILGKVVGRDASPWADAEVTLLSHPLMMLPEFGETDRIVVRADRRGRFRAALRVDRTYAAWAKHTAKDGTRVTQALVNVEPKRILKLTETSFESLPVRVQIRGLAAWKPHGVKAVLIDCIDDEHALELDDNDETRIDGLPGEHCWIELRSNGGTQLARHLVWLTRKRRRAVRDWRRKHAKPAGAEPPLDLEAIELGAPIRANFQLRHPKHNRSIAGATIRFMSNTWHQPTAKTDARGRASLLVPRPTTQTWCLAFLAVANGRLMRTCGWANYEADGGTEEIRYVGDDLVAKPATPQQLVYMSRGFELVGSICSGSTPVNDLALFTAIPYGHRRQRAHANSITWPKKGGGYRVAGMLQSSWKLFHALLIPEAAEERLFGKCEIPRNRWLQIPTGQPLDVARFDVDVERLRVADLSFVAPDGKPVPFVRVEVFTKNALPVPTEMQSRLPPQIMADRKGRCRVIAFAGKTELLAVSEDHYFLGELPRGTARIAMKRMKRVLGIVTDESARPIANADLRYDSRNRHSEHIPIARAHSWNKSLLRASTDAAGRFDLRYIPAEKGLFLHVRWPANRKPARGQEVALPIDDDVVPPLRIELRR